ncbi:MAG: XRE family transcriptional regulator [Candidatus Promineifilaceae bacterium]|nr:XRE family transcriptional regulator [Candidatus Promineifilaceae bacterium]
MTVNIGKNIRKRRKELGMNLRQLGEEAGLSVGFLSQVENDQVSPSLASLLAIATSLGVPVFYFLNSQEPDPVVRKAERRQLTFPKTRTTIDLLSRNLNWQLMPILMRLEPHTVRQALQLTKSTEQWVYVLQGRMRIEIGGESHLLDQGDTIHYNGELLTEVASVSDEELIFICCITPPAL